MIRREHSPDPSTRNPRSVWRFSSESYKGAHFATYPTELPFRCITASTSKAGVCPTCGSQYTPVVSKERRATRPGETTKVPGRNSRAFQERDPQPTAPPVPKTFGELKNGQCFTVSGDDRTKWRRGNDFMFLAVDGRIFSHGSELDTPITFIHDIEMVLEEQP